MQRCISDSSTEAQYIYQSKRIQTVCYHHVILRELGETLESTDVYESYQRCVAKATDDGNPGGVA